ncbi:hypothetical protein F5B20DRAFT_591449 [Whalleya microplaca]|nr:hypothetical protein F5B20DRAFT_591449 [Whalleya microplaca]
MSDNAQAPISHISAWRAKQSEIETFLTESQGRDATSTAYIHAAHASGKSTSLLAHVIDMFQSGKIGPVVYVLARPSDAKSLCKCLQLDVHAWPNAPWIREHVSTQLGQGPLVLSSYKSFSSWVQAQANKLHPRTTLLVDVELRATVDGELFFGSLFEMAQPSRIPLTIVCLAAHLSTRRPSSPCPT